MGKHDPEHCSMDPDQPYSLERAEEDYEIAKQVFWDGDLPHAVFHLGCALSLDPTRPEWTELFDEIIDAAPETLELVPIDPEGCSFTQAAARAYVEARQGDINAALNLLLQVCQVVPDLDYISWAVKWLENPLYAKAADLDIVGSYLAGIARQYPGDEIPDQVERGRVYRLVPMLQSLLAQNPEHPAFLMISAAIFRKLGLRDEALTMAEQMFQRSPGYETAVAVAMAARALGNRDKTIEFLNKAHNFDREEISIQLDLGDCHCLFGEFAEGIKWYEQVLRKEPGHPWAEPHLFSARFRKGDGPQWRDRLEEYVARNPDNGPAKERLDEISPYVGFLPEATEATTNTFRSFFDENRLHELSGQLRIAVTGPEPPSCYLAARLLFAVNEKELNLQLLVPQTVPGRDPRQPAENVPYLLWEFSRPEGVPNLPPPAEAVRDAVMQLVRFSFHIDHWWEMAGEIAFELGEGALPDLMGMLVHPPLPPSPQIPAWDWVRHVQMATTLVLARLGIGWEGSARQKALTSLLLGPCDWTTEMAVVAAVKLAAEEEAISPQVLSLIQRMAQTIPTAGHWPHRYAWFVCGQKLPDFPAEAIRRLRELQIAEERNWTDSDAQPSDDTPEPPPTESPGILGRLRSLFGKK